MRRKRNPTGIKHLLLIPMLIMLPACAFSASPVVINEVFASHTGIDNSEYIELYGTPGTPLLGLSLLVVDATSPSGFIRRRLDFNEKNVIGSNGFFLIGNPVGLAENYASTPNVAVSDNYLKNSSITIALVRTPSIEGNSISGNEQVLDAVGLSAGEATAVFYFAAPELGPDGGFFPAGARRLHDGVDTDTVIDWVLSDFNLGPDNTPVAGNAPPLPPALNATLMDIQGAGQYSPLAGERIVTTGIVTLYTRNGANFWMQDPQGDGNASTSDGIFVAGGGFPRAGSKPEVGDLIRITAFVQELQFGNALPLTRLHKVAEVEVLSSANALPKPVRLRHLPDESISAGIDYWEALEGMMVSIDEAVVVAPTTRFGEFVMVAKANQEQGSGYYDDSKHLLVRSTGAQAVDYNPERILVDDGSLARALEVQPGMRVKDFTGVVDYTFGNFKLQVASIHVDDDCNSCRKSKRYVKESNDKRLSVASYNLENLFDLVDDPGKDDAGSTPSAAALEIKLTKLSRAIVEKLQVPDIILVQEVENQEILQVLAQRVNDTAASGYQSLSFDSSDVRGIEVGVLWNSHRLDLLHAEALAGKEIERAFGASSASPGREPLMAVFQFLGHNLTVVGNHFKSKSGDDELFGIRQPPRRDSETQRKLQAAAVRGFVDRWLMSDHRANVIVAGDFNDFAFAEPGEGEDHTLGILQGREPGYIMSNLIQRVAPAQRYSYIFEGNAQVLDHMLVSPALYDRFEKIVIPHINADFPAALARDAGTVYRGSDHDPIIAEFEF